MTKRDQDKPGDDFGSFRPADDLRRADRGSPEASDPRLGRTRDAPLQRGEPPRIDPGRAEPQPLTARPARPPQPTPPQPIAPVGTHRPPAPDDFIAPASPQPPAPQGIHSQPSVITAFEEPLPRVARTGPVRASHATAVPPPPRPRQESPRPRPATRPSAPRRESDDDEPTGRSWTKIIGASGLGIAALVAASAIALLAYTPVDLVRDRLVREVKAKTGRDLIIGGKPSVSFWPTVAVSLPDVSLSNPSGMSGPPLIAMQRLDATIQLWPLLQRRVQVDQLVLQSPLVFLSVDGQGRRNWDFAGLESGPWRSPVRVAQSGKLDLETLPEDLRDFAKGASGFRSAARSSADGMSLGRVRVLDGALTHHDERTGIVDQWSTIDLTIDAPDLAGPLQAAGTLMWRGEAMRLDTRLMPARALVSGAPIQTTAAIGSGPVQATFNGVAETGGTRLKLDGVLAVKSPSLVKAAQWLGRPIVGEPAHGPVAFKGRVVTSGGKVSVSDGSIQMPGVSMSGALSLDSAGVRPKVVGQIRLAEADFDKLATLRLLEPTSRPGSVRPVSTMPSKAEPLTAPQPRSIEDLLKTESAPPKAQVRGFLDRGGWGEQPIDLTALSAADVDLKIAFNRLGANALGAGPGHATVLLNDRVLKLTLDDVTLHEGKVRGTVTLDAAAQRPALAINLVADGVALQPLLKGTNGEVIDGKARMTLSLNSTGRSERQLIDSLSGKAEMLVPRGAFLGIDLSKAVAGLPRGQLPSFEKVAGARTEFTDLGATFNVTRGVADNRDFRVVTREVRAIGNGQIALGPRTIDAVVRPKLTAPVPSPAGAGGPGVSLAGLDLPIRITGPLDKPKVSADFGEALRRPGEVIDALKQLDPKGEVQETVKGVLAGDDAAKKKARDFLNNLLKR